MMGDIADSMFDDMLIPDEEEMAEQWKPQSRETIKHYYDTIIEEASDELNDWELRFITNIGSRILNGCDLTEAQEKKLEDIYVERTK